MNTPPSTAGTETSKLAPPKWVLAPSIIVTVAFFIGVCFSSYTLSVKWISISSFGTGMPLVMQNGWMFDRNMDITDPQWRSYRSFLPLLLAAATAHLLISKAIRYVFHSRIIPILLYQAAFSISFLVYVHHTYAIFPIGVSIISFLISKIFGASKLTPILTWLFNLTILFTSDYFKGYSISMLTGGLLGHLEQDTGPLLWRVCFNVSMLRLISFNVDKYETLRYNSVRNLLPLSSNEPAKTSNFDENRTRQEGSFDPQVDYNFLYFFVYVFYVPLYIGGPVTGYNAFLSFIKYKQQEEVNLKQRVKLTVMALLYVLALEFGLHFLYSAGMNEKELWRPESPIKMTPIQVGVTGLVTLIFMYMKFLSIWRLFRVWALWDGINPPENMMRCIFNNYTVQGFWRSWHRSLYLFIVKYIYVPLGGSKNRMYSVWLIFAFIAVWHDLWTRWLAWALANCVLIMCETFVVQVIGKSTLVKRIKASSTQEKPYYNLLVSFAGGLCIMGMAVSNLAIMYGFEGSLVFLQQLLLQEGGPLFGIFMLFAVPFGIQVMLYLHEKERKDLAAT